MRLALDVAEDLARWASNDTDRARAITYATATEMYGFYRQLLHLDLVAFTELLHRF